MGWPSPPPITLLSMLGMLSFRRRAGPTHMGSGAVAPAAGGPSSYPAAALAHVTMHRVPNLRIVLVEPQEAGNVGAVARVMKNFGHDDLWIVGEHPELLPVSSWWASGADDLLAAARFASTLQD